MEYVLTESIRIHADVMGSLEIVVRTSSITARIVKMVQRVRMVFRKMDIVAVARLDISDPTVRV